MKIIRYLVVLAAIAAAVVFGARQASAFLGPAMLAGGSASVTGPVSIACDIGQNYAGTVPGPASAAGFTHCAANYDFTQTLPSSWINCNGNNTSAQWYYGWDNGGDVRPPCSSVFQTTDPLTGGTALDIQWLTSYLSLGSSNYNNKGLIFLNTRSNDGTAGTYFPHGYYELRFRVQPIPNTYSGSFMPNGTNMAFWTSGEAWAKQSSFEWDFLEMDPGAFTASGLWQWFGITNGNKQTAYNSPDTNFPGDARQYQKIGTLSTGDGASGAAMCVYFNDSFVGSCVTQSYASGSTEKTDRYPVYLSDGIACQTGSGGSSCMPGDLQKLDMYITAVRVWSCTNWQSSMCYTSLITSPP